MRWTPRCAASVVMVLLVGVASPARAGKTVWLDELDVTRSTCGWQTTQRNRSVGGNPLRLGGQRFRRGVGTHAPGKISVNLAGGSKRFSALIGIDDETGNAGSAEFKVIGDGKVLYASGVVRGVAPGKEVSVDVTGVKRLDLVVTVAGDGFAHDHTDWIEAKFEGVGKRPTIIPLRRPAPPRKERERTRPHPRYSEKLAAQTFHPAAMDLPSDRDAADAALRRTAALQAHLRQMDGAPDLSAEQARLDKLIAENTATAAGDQAARAKLLEKVRTLRRKVAFANPLLDFDKILFIKRHFNPNAETTGNHMCDQFFGFHAIRGGGLFVLVNPFSDRPMLRNVLAEAVCENGRFRGRKLDETGGYLSPDLSFDGKTILFAYTDIAEKRRRYTWNENNTWHIFRVNADGSHLRQVTDGKTNDFDPCWLPNGRIAFISERRGGYGRCHGRPVPSFTLHSMNADGSDIVRLSPHETNEWHPSVTHEGLIVYTRWDYVDRGFNQAHHAWVTTPDGRNSRAVHGNFARVQGGRPHMEMDVRAIPGSHRYIATAACHHGQAYGALVLIDPKVEEDDLMSTVKRITPDQPFPESECRTHFDPANYASAWPLSEHFYLCVYDPNSWTDAGTRNNYGIYLLDAFGNRELLYRDPNISCLNPMPLRPRPRPPVIPHATLEGAPPSQRAARLAGGAVPDTALVGVLDVYDGLYRWPEGTRITALRILQLLPKTTPYANNPRIGHGSQKSARAVLGTVPVETDGSAYFLMPVGKPVYFQALDANGMALQSMRSATYVHPGEMLLCKGCHDRRWRSPGVGKPALAMRRPPSRIRPEVDGSKPFSFPRLVQPVLDQHCVPCHEKNRTKKAPDLTQGDLSRNNGKFYPSYQSLRNHAFFFTNDSWTTPRTIPGRFGAHASKLYRMLSAGSHKKRVKLSRQDLHRITLWLDCNSDFFGSYKNLKNQARGEIVQPTLE